MPEQVRMHGLRYTSLFSIVLNYLLNPPSGIPLPMATLKQVPVGQMACKMRLQGQGKCIRKQNIPVLIPFTSRNEDLPCLDIHIINSNAGQLTDPDGGIEQQP